MPHVSVLMPVRNGERFVLDAVESILHQTLDDLELIIVDDASTDATAALLDRLSDPRVTFIRNQQASGPAAARNAALDLSRGELVALLDADDRSTPDRLQRQAHFLESHADHVLVGSSFRLIDEGGRGVGWTPVLLANEELRRDMFTRNPFGNSTLMVRREALVRAGTWNETWRVAEDYELTARLLAQGKVANIADPLTDYRIHPAQTRVTEQLAQAARLRDQLWDEDDPPSLTMTQLRDDRRRYLSEAPHLWPCYIRRHLTLIAEAARRRRSNWLRTHVAVAGLLLAWRARHR